MATRATKQDDTEKNDIIQSLEKQIESLQSDVHVLLKAVNGKDGQHKIMDTATDALDTASDAIAKTTQKTADEAAHELAKVEKMVKDQPIQALAIALGVGAALALLARG